MTKEEAKDIFSEYHTGEVIDYDYAIELVAKYCNKKEPIDEEKLDELAKTESPFGEEDFAERNQYYHPAFIEGFKAGYSKAIEE